MNIKNSALITFMLFLLFLTGCANNVTTSKIPGEEFLSESNELKSITTNFKLPTYIPYEIENIFISKSYLGPMDLRLNVEEQIDENPNYVYPSLQYTLINNEEAQKIFFTIDIKIGSLDSWSFYTPELLVNITDEVEGIYYFDGRNQILSWEDGEYLYDIKVLSDKEIAQELIKEEELIKIAQSFEKY